MRFPLVLMTVLIALASPLTLMADRPTIPEALPKLLFHPKPIQLEPLEVEDQKGQMHDLSRLSKTLLLVNYWASWCPPCREEMPALSRLADTSGPHLDVVTVSTDRGGYAKAKAFYDEIAITTPLLYADPRGETARLLGLRGLPATLLIFDGQEVGRYYGPAHWDAPEVLHYLQDVARFYRDQK